jgi:hypothetical protein
MMCKEMQDKIVLLCYVNSFATIHLLWNVRSHKFSDRIHLTRSGRVS